MLTLEQLKQMEPHQIISRGCALDNEMGINMSGSGLLLTWIAVRGGTYDWAIYCHYATQPDDFILARGDKIVDKNTILRLVPCDIEAYQAYRR